MQFLTSCDTHPTPLSVLRCSVHTMLRRQGMRLAAASSPAALFAVVERPQPTAKSAALLSAGAGATLLSAAAPAAAGLAVGTAVASAAYAGRDAARSMARPLLVRTICGRSHGGGRHSPPESLAKAAAGLRSMGTQALHRCEATAAQAAPTLSSSRIIAACSQPRPLAWLAMIARRKPMHARSRSGSHRHLG